MSSKTFFKKLKETCGKIDSDVNDIKNKMTAGHETDDEVSSKRIWDIQDKIKSLKTDAIDLKSMLEPKLAHTRDFIKNFKELIAETEVSISKKEDYLKQYGYKPLELVPEVSVPPDSSNVTPSKKESEGLPTTPNLLDYGIASYSCAATTPDLKSRNSSIENLVIPPDLELTNPVKCNGTSDSTPTLDIFFTSGAKTKETPPLPEPLPNNVATFPSTPTLIL